MELLRCIAGHSLYSQGYDDGTPATVPEICEAAFALWAKSANTLHFQQKLPRCSLFRLWNLMNLSRRMEGCNDGMRGTSIADARRP